MSQPDLVVVSSPLQYVNAVEWRRRSDGAADLVLIGDRAGGPRAVLDLVRRHRGLWGRVLSHPQRPALGKWAPRLVRDAADAGHRTSLERLGASLGARSRVVFGDYRNVSQRALVAAVRHDELVLVDDGSVAPQVAAARAGEGPDDARFRPGWLRTPLGQAAFGERAPAAPKALAFFTIYGAPMERTLAPDDRIVGHAYDSWRAEAPTARRGEDVWLLGSNHVDAGICAAEDYRALVLAGAAALRAERPGGRLVYRPHRGEDAARAAPLAAEAGAGFTPSGAPVEVAYLDAAERPAAVAVVASSAADTLGVIDPDLAILRFALPPGYLRAQREHILAVIAGHDAFNPRLRVLATDGEAN